MSQPHTTPPRRQQPHTAVSGFTLLEVLVAIFILTIGLLGLASLQIAGTRNTNSAYMRSQASVLAYDLADRIRANRIGDYITPLPNGTQRNACLSTTGCSADNMAENDIFEWQNAIATALPLGSGTVSLNSGVYTLSITWDDRFSGTAAQTFSTSFAP